MESPNKALSYDTPFDILYLHIYFLPLWNPMSQQPLVRFGSKVHIGTYYIKPTYIKISSLGQCMRYFILVSGFKIKCFELCILWNYSSSGSVVIVGCQIIVNSKII